MDDLVLLAADVGPVVACAAWRSDLAPDLAADLFDGHADAVGVVPSAAEVLHEEGGHVAVDGADPVGGLKAEE